MSSLSRNPMNDNPVSQCQVTSNGCVDIDCFKNWKAITSEKTERDGLDFPFGKEMPQDTSGVVVHEIALKHKRELKTVGSIYRNRKIRKLDPMLTPVFTNLAGMPISQPLGTQLSTEQKKYKIWKKIKLAGIVKTSRDELKPDGTDKDHGRIDTAIGIGGIDPILNNGDKTIYAGNLIVAELPLDDKENNITRPTEQGTSKEKKLVITEPYDYNKIISMDSILNLINTYPDAVALREHVRNRDYDDIPFYECLRCLSDLMGGYTGFYEPETQQQIQALMLSFFENQYEYNSRVIGVALTDIAPNCQGDIKVSTGYCL